MGNVSRYAITITPLDSNGKASDEASQTTVRVDVREGRVHIKELTVRVGDTSQLTHGDMLNLDFDVLAQVFSAPAPRPGVRQAVGHPAPTPPAQASVSPTRAASRRRTPAKIERAYRRMPDPDEVRATYLKSRTITGVAAFYDVPTHTAQGWISRLRRKGIIPAST